jgi:hypothetical protein
LAVEERSDCDFITSDVLRDGFEGQVLLLLGLEEGWGGWRKTRDELLLQIR